MSIESIKKEMIHFSRLFYKNEWNYREKKVEEHRARLQKLLNQLIAEGTEEDNKEQYEELKDILERAIKYLAVDKRAPFQKHRIKKMLDEGQIK